MKQQQLSLALAAGISTIGSACEVPSSVYPIDPIRDQQAQLVKCVLSPSNMRPSTQNRKGSRGVDYYNFHRRYREGEKGDVVFRTTCKKTDNEMIVRCVNGVMQQGNIPQNSDCTDEKEGMLCEGGFYVQTNSTEFPTLSSEFPTLIKFPHSKECLDTIRPDTHQEQMQRFLNNIANFIVMLRSEEPLYMAKYADFINNFFIDCENLSFNPDHEDLFVPGKKEKSALCQSVLEQIPFTREEAMSRYERVKIKSRMEDIIRYKEKEREKARAKEIVNRRLIRRIMTHEHLSSLLIKRGDSTYEVGSSLSIKNDKYTLTPNEIGIFLAEEIIKATNQCKEGNSFECLLKYLRDDIEFTRKKDLEAANKQISDIKSEFGLTIDYKTPINNRLMKGEPITNIGMLHEIFLYLTNAFKKYPDGFIKKSGLRKIRFLSTLVYKKNIGSSGGGFAKAGGFANYRTIAIVVGKFGANHVSATFDHEFFHILDGLDGTWDNRIWANNNQNGISDYLFKSGTAAILSGGFKIDDIIGFADPYGKAGGPNEDQSTVSTRLRYPFYAKDILRRCKTDPVLRAKVVTITACDLVPDGDSFRCGRLLSPDEYRKISGFSNYQYWYKWSKGKMGADYWNGLWKL